MSMGSSQRPPLYAPFTPLRLTTSNIQILFAQDYYHSKIHQYTMITMGQSHLQGNTCFKIFNLC